MKSLSKQSVNSRGSAPVFITARASELEFTPAALTQLICAQLQTDTNGPSESEAERRVAAVRRSAEAGGADPLFAFALEDIPSEYLDPKAPDPGAAELVNQSTLLGFAFANCCCGLESGGEYLWLNELHVARNARGRGIGSGLLTTIESWARERGALYIACLTGLENAAARAMYVREGYRISEVSWVEKYL